MDKNNDFMSEIWDLSDEVDGISKSVLDQRIEEALRKYSDSLDKIRWLQIAHSYNVIHSKEHEIMQQLWKELSIDEYGLNLLNKFEKIQFNIRSFINPRLLSEKYKDIEKYIFLFGLEPLEQDRILNLSDSQYKLFLDIIQVVEKQGMFEPAILDYVLRNISTSYLPATSINWYKTLNNDIEQQYLGGEHLTEEDIEKLLYIYSTRKSENIESLDELRKLSFIKKGRLKEALQGDDINEIRENLLQYAYGFSINEAKDILNKYKISENALEQQENREILELYMAILKIINSTDINELKAVATSLLQEKNIETTYMRKVAFHSELRKMFLREFESTLFDLKNTPPIGNARENTNIYKASGEFNLIVTCIGSYQADFSNKDNYAQYWNMPRIEHRTNPCSLIGNDNLTTTKIKNVVFGFNNFDENMLFNMYNMDYNSTPNSQSVTYSSDNAMGAQFRLSQDLKDNTRTQYNELMFDRRQSYDISDIGKKKQPDYIVFFEEYENESIVTLTDAQIDAIEDDEKKEILKRQKSMWNESLKAARDFDIPVVIVNREECAIREKQIIEQYMNELEEGNVNIVQRIITRFENNRMGNGNSHKYIRDKYFSKEEMDRIIQKMLEYNNPIIAKKLFDTIKKEQEKWNRNNGASKRFDGQASAIDFEKYLELEKQMEKVFGGEEL